MVNCMVPTCALPLQLAPVSSRQTLNSGGVVTRGVIKEVASFACVRHLGVYSPVRDGRRCGMRH